jgi:hypothetical protein
MTPTYLPFCYLPFEEKSGPLLERKFEFPLPKDGLYQGH